MVSVFKATPNISDNSKGRYISSLVFLDGKMLKHAANDYSMIKIGVTKLVVWIIETKIKRGFSQIMLFHAIVTQKLITHLQMAGPDSLNIIILT